MQRWVDQADDDRITIHRLEQTVEVLALVGEKLVERFRPTLTGFREDHLLYDGQALGFEEHVLGATESNAHGTIRACALCILWIICIGPYLETARRITLCRSFTHILAGGDFICPGKQGQ